MRRPIMMHGPRCITRGPQGITAGITARRRLTTGRARVCSADVAVLCPGALPWLYGAHSPPIGGFAYRRR